MLDPAALSDLLGLLRANGVTRYKSGDFEVELGAAPRGPTAEPDFPDLLSRAEQERQDAMTEEDVLFAAVPGGAPGRSEPEPDATGGGAN